MAFVVDVLDGFAFCEAHQILGTRGLRSSDGENNPSGGNPAGGFQITWNCACVSKFKRLLRDDPIEEIMHTNHWSILKCLNSSVPNNHDKTKLRSVFFRGLKTSLNRWTKVRRQAAMESGNPSFLASLKVFKSVTPRRWDAKSGQKCGGQRARSHQWLLIGLGTTWKIKHAGPKPILQIVHSFRVLPLRTLIPILSTITTWQGRLPHRTVSEST